MNTYIVYLEPKGELKRFTDLFFERSAKIQRNEAHLYMPHCSLTGFFHTNADPQAMVKALDDDLSTARIQSLPIPGQPILTKSLIIPILNPPTGLAKKIVETLSFFVNVRSKKADHVSLAYFNNRIKYSEPYDFMNLHAMALESWRRDEGMLLASLSWDIAFYQVSLSETLEKVH
jgi:hypothetical protein